MSNFARYIKRHHIALLALFFALGGTSFAAANALLPKNSVGSAQVRNGSLQKLDLSKKTVSSLRGNRGLRGPQGAQGVQGLRGATGGQGVQGPAGPITGILPSQVTLKGMWAVRLANSLAGQRLQTALSFGLQLPSAPIAHFIPLAGPVPAGCTGTAASPGANPGHLCVFEQFADNITAATQTTFNTAGTDGVSDKFGAGLAANATSGSGSTPVDTRWRGSWAVTAP